MSELKKCPFCGGEAAYIQILGNYERPHEVYCSTCDGGITEGRSKDGVIHNWNNRPIEDALNARIAELEAALVSSGNQQRLYLEELLDLRPRIAELEAENVNLSKKVTDYEKELRQSYKYDKTCSTCRYLDENRDCVLGIRCVNYTLWQGKIL